MTHQWRLTAVCMLCALQTAAVAEEPGFVKIFDGKSLDGWRTLPEGRAGDWTVHDGVLVGKSNGKGSDLVWKEDDLGDFELKLSYRFRTDGNSGIYIRGRVGESESYHVKGYHADFGNVGVGPHVLGAWDFHGTPRGSQLVHCGQRVVIDEQGNKRFSEIDDAVAETDIRKRDWNDVHVVARGFRLYFTINDRMASEVIDNEVEKRIAQGTVGLQIHGGKPMTVEFRDILLKRLSPE